MKFHMEARAASVLVCAAAGLLAGAVANVAVSPGHATGNCIQNGSTGVYAQLLGGNDCYYGGGGNDTILGGSGHDHIYGQTDRDRVDGEGGSDHTEGGSGNDSGSTGGFAHYVRGGGNDDEIYGNEHDDTLYAQDGVRDDPVAGGGETDVCYRDAIDAVQTCEF